MPLALLAVLAPTPFHPTTAQCLDITSSSARLQDVKGKTAQMDADLASKQAALEAQEQARDIARDKAESIDARIATLSE